MRFQILNTDINLSDDDGSLLVTCEDTNRLKESFLEAVNTLVHKNLHLNINLVTTNDLNLLENLKDYTELGYMLHTVSNVESLGNEGLHHITSLIKKREYMLNPKGSVHSHINFNQFNVKRISEHQPVIHNEVVILAGLSRLNHLYPNEVSILISKANQLGITILAFCSDIRYLESKKLDSSFEHRVNIEITAKLNRIYKH